MKSRQRVNTAPPSKAALEEMPEFNFARSTGRGREGLRKAIAELHKRGRPKAGAASHGVTPRSIRFAAKTWDELEEHARARKTTRHELLRSIVIKWLAAHDAKAS